MRYWHGEDRDLLMPLRLSELAGEHVNYSQIIITFHSIYDYFALLKAFNTNTLNFRQYFKEKLSSHQPSHMHHTRHKQIVILILHYLSYKNPKMLFVPSNSHMEQPTRTA